MDGLARTRLMRMKRGDVDATHAFCSSVFSSSLTV